MKTKKTANTTLGTIRFPFGLCSVERLPPKQRKKEKTKSPLLRKSAIDHKFMEPYFFDSENMEVTGDDIPRPLYDHAKRLEEERVFDGGGKDLESIEKEIKVSCKITSSEVFKRGELLTLAKELCRQQNKRFQQWMHDTFDFSTETGNNYMNVFKYCFGRRDVALEAVPSVLYKISSPSFPKLLREFLFDQGNLEKLTNGECQKLIKKFKEGGGIEAIEPEIEQMNSDRYAYRQVKYTIDLYKSYYANLVELKVKIENRGERRPTIHFKDRFNTFEPVASEINNNLYRIVKRCSEDLEAGIAEALKMLDEKWQSARE